MSQDDNKPDQKDSENAIPEVEAEVVSDDETVSPAFDDEPVTEEEKISEAEESAAEPAKRKSTLTPGVILFIAFAIAALIAFGYWRMQSDPADETAQTPVATPAVDDDPTDEEARSQDEPATTDKTSNLPADDLKPEPTEAEADDTFLPPVGDDAAKLENNFGDEAKTPAPTEAQPEETPDPSTEQDEAIAPTEEAQVEQTQAEEAQNEDRDPAEDLGEDVVASEDVPEAAPADSEPAESEPEQSAAVIDAPQPDNTYQEEIAALKDEFSQQTDRLNAALTAEREKNDALLGEINALRQDLSSALSSRDAQIDRELSELRAAVVDLRERQPKITPEQIKAGLSLDTLKLAIDRGTPYATELADVTALAPDLTAPLSRHAQTGIPTIAELRDRFDAAARKAIAADAQANAGSGVAGVMARAKNIISVRPAEPRAGDSAAAIISRADAALDDGDVAYALIEIEKLSDAAQESMKDWIADATARANASATLRALDARLANAVE
ncbi:mitofilin family membrane protein [Hyphococcus sp. DH-69]|uniref:COG4223 family protein n=1 Tax=Hyphococcus formosus TaxID=3143534 RepID=UPI00398A7DE9